MEKRHQRLSEDEDMRHRNIGGGDLPSHWIGRDAPNPYDINHGRTLPRGFFAAGPRHSTRHDQASINSSKYSYYRGYYDR